MTPPQAKREAVALAGCTQLQHQALTQVARADTWRIEILNDLQHGLHFRLGERRDIGLDLALLRFALQELVETFADLVERAREVAVVVDVADELVGEERLTRV